MDEGAQDIKWVIILEIQNNRTFVLQIGELRTKLADMEKSERDRVNHYESQLSSLKAEVATLKREYEKLKKLHHKYLQREKMKTANEMEDSLSELKRLTAKIEVTEIKSYTII